MVRSMPWKLALIAVGALASLALLAGQSFAEDSEGIVRICDQVPGQSMSGGNFSAGQAASGCCVAVQGVAGHSAALKRAAAIQIDAAAGRPVGTGSTSIGMGVVAGD